jgi:hypothetical protein
MSIFRNQQGQPNWLGNHWGKLLGLIITVLIIIWINACGTGGTFKQKAESLFCARPQVAANGSGDANKGGTNAIPAVATNTPASGTNTPASTASATNPVVNTSGNQCVGDAVNNTNSRTLTTSKELTIGRIKVPAGQQLTINEENYNGMVVQINHNVFRGSTSIEGNSSGIDLSGQTSAQEVRDAMNAVAQLQPKPQKWPTDYHPQRVVHIPGDLGSFTNLAHGDFELSAAISGLDKIEGYLQIVIDEDGWTASPVITPELESALDGVTLTPENRKDFIQRQNGQLVGKVIDIHPRQPGSYPLKVMIRKR